MCLGWPVSLCVLTRPSLCRLQLVSAPQSVCFLACPDKFLPLPSPERGCAFGRSVSFCVLTSPSFCRLQRVSTTPRSVGFLACPDKSIPRHSSVCECFVVDFFTPPLICPPFSVLAESWFFFLYFPFFDVFIPFLGTSAHFKQTKIVLLQCAVIIFLFYLDFTDKTYSPVFVYLLAMTQITL